MSTNTTLTSFGLDTPTPNQDPALLPSLHPIQIQPRSSLAQDIYGSNTSDVMHRKEPLEIIKGLSKKNDTGEDRLGKLGKGSLGRRNIDRELGIFPYDDI